MSYYCENLVPELGSEQFYKLFRVIIPETFKTPQRAFKHVLIKDTLNNIFFENLLTICS